MPPTIAESIPDSTPNRDWVERGECWTGRGKPEDVAIFYKASKKEAALAMCHRCEVAQECLDYAIETHQTFGVWGGVVFSREKDDS